MALVKYGGGIIQMAGSIGGNTFARNRYGNYARSKTVPVNPRSTRQLVVRQIIAMLVARWSSVVTDAQRVAWNQYADAVSMQNRLGEAVKLSGFNHYCRSNAPLILQELDAVDDAPTVYELPDQDPTLAASGVSATGKITVTYDAGLDWAGEVGGHLLLSAGRPQNPQVNFFAGPYRVMGKVDGAVSPPSGTIELDAPFGMGTGNKVWVRARIARADGRLSQPFCASFLST